MQFRPWPASVCRESCVWRNFGSKTEPQECAKEIAMALEVTPVNRNLHQRVTFMGLEFEDLFVVLGVAALMNVVSHFVSGTVGGIPLSGLVQYGNAYYSAAHKMAHYVHQRCHSQHHKQ